MGARADARPLLPQVKAGCRRACGRPWAVSSFRQAGLLRSFELTVTNWRRSMVFLRFICTAFGKSSRSWTVQRSGAEQPVGWATFLGTAGYSALAALQRR